MRKTRQGAFNILSTEHNDLSVWHEWELLLFTSRNDLLKKVLELGNIECVEECKGKKFNHEEKWEFNKWRKNERIKRKNQTSNNDKKRNNVNRSWNCSFNKSVKRCQKYISIKSSNSKKKYL